MFLMHEEESPMGKRAGNLGILICFVMILITACGSPDLVIGCTESELVSAINTANNDPGHTTIIIEEGCLINLTAVDNQMDYQEGYSGESGYTGLPPITTPITIEGNDSTIQRLNSAPEMRFFFITSSGELTLEEVTLNNGLVQSGQIHQRNGGAIFNRGILNLNQSHVLDSYAEDSGGGIFNADVGTLNIDNSSVSYNEAAKHGGAIMNGGTTVIDGYSTIINNQALGGSGGAIYNADALTINFSHVNFNQAQLHGGAIATGHQTTTTIDGVLFEGNQSTDGGGGAIYFVQSSFTITECTFDQNQTIGENAPGGAIMIDSSNGSIGDTSAFVDNISSRGGGGVAIYLESMVEIDTTAFQSNTAAITGGGLANYAQGNTTLITNSIFASNSATSGGGIYNATNLRLEKSLVNGNISTQDGAGIYNGGEMLNLINSTVSGNSNQNVGGGILNYGTIEINFATIAFNQSVHGGGIYANLSAGGTVTVKNSIFSNNSAQSCSVFGSINSLGDNLDDDGSCQGFNLTDNPLLDSLDYNGGPSRTHAFLFNSPAVDNVTDCTTISGNLAVSEDQRSEPRPFNNQCDLGAYEAQSTPPDFQAMILVQIEEIQCYEGPGEDFNRVESFAAGESLTALGINEAGDWLGVAGRNGNGGEVSCWVKEEGVESFFDLGQYPILPFMEHPPEPGKEMDDDDSVNGFERCGLFAPETYSLFLLDIPWGTGDLTTYLKMPEGVHGLEILYPEDTEPWNYYALLGHYEDHECTFDGYAGHLYCRFEIPETYFGTVRELQISVNGCPDPFYIHSQVTIPEPPDPSDGSEPLTCTADLGEAECIEAGGSYPCASADCACVCP
jgi:predicted outer membrane repeat protein